MSPGTRLHPPELTFAIVGRSDLGWRGVGRDAPPATSLDPVGVDVADEVEPSAPEKLGGRGITALHVDGLGIETHDDSPRLTCEEQELRSVPGEDGLGMAAAGRARRFPTPNPPGEVERSVQLPGVESSKL